MNIKCIVITGGPCAGKSSAMEWIRAAGEQSGYVVLFVPETATEFITGGVAPWTCGTNLDYQKCQMELQLTKERLFKRAAATMKADRILIVCDRAALDNRAYMNEDEFQTVLDHVGETEESLLARYDAVIHLMTTAKGQQEAYTTANNVARIETVEEACALDDRLLEAWKKHPHHCVIDSAKTFEDKMAQLCDELKKCLEN